MGTQITFGMAPIRDRDSYENLIGKYVTFVTPPGRTYSGMICHSNYPDFVCLNPHHNTKQIDGKLVHLALTSPAYLKTTSVESFFPITEKDFLETIQELNKEIKNTPEEKPK